MSVINNRKGQISIEFLVLVAIFLLFFQAIIMPTVNFSEKIVSDVSSLSLTKQNIDKLSNYIESFANSNAYGKRIMFFYLPNNAKITNCISSGNSTSPSLIDYEVTLEEHTVNHPNCDKNGFCSFQKEIYVNNISCDSVGPGFRSNLVIEKTSAGVLSFNEQ